MNNSLIEKIRGIQRSDGNAHSKTPTSAQTETVTRTRAIAAQLEKAGNQSNVSIHFRVDDETNEVTVFLVDRKTKRVLRSIPASELQKLQIGELLKLTG